MPYKQWILTGPAQRYAGSSTGAKNGTLIWGTSTNVEVTTEAWAGKHNLVSSVHTDDSCEIWEAEFNYGSGNYNRPTSTSAIMIIKY